ncbi:hypothetical protein A8C32_09675 [Flavivirga aquatica]|uniref:Outer membrane protein beta-barrel domain-containing protein n=1 Tax=Flavivirga aquatica TaxID=1849968 RepID=A0A1E5TEG8_9FLAO|nr:hypothetical protein [Flavivirga aquatica]OEK09773.1 hypothetical protein A8C32_09675 [Flavivirga aquatica]
MKQFTIFFTIFISFSVTSFGQGKLKQAEESLTIEEEINKSITKPKHNTYSSNSNDSDGNFLTEAIARLFVHAFLYASYYAVIESPVEREHRASNAFITKHPYSNSNKGNYSYNWDDDSEIFRTTVSNRFIFETNKLYGNHLNIDMKLLQRVGLEMNYLQLWEENANFRNNTLAIYTALAKYQRVRTERFNAWWGLGAAYIDGDVDELGFTYGLGAELFFTKPFSLESNFNQTLINDSSVNKFNALLNFHKKHYKFTGGYEYLKVGDVSFSTFSVGVGVSF